MSERLNRKYLHFLPPGARKVLRTYFHRVANTIHRTRFRNVPVPRDGWPILLNISVPKSGTHLLSQILTGLARVSPYAAHVPYVLNSRNLKTGQVLPSSHALKYLDSLRPLDIGTAHLIFYEDVATRVSGREFIAYFIYRDPRDIVVSHAYFAGEIDANHFLYSFLHPLTMEQRISEFICGISGSHYEYDGANKLNSSFIGWLDQPTVFPVRFEDIVCNQRETLGKITDHFLRRVDTLPASREQIMDALQSNIDPQLSPTFRSGKTGEWRQHFTDQHKKLFKDAAGDLLIKLGYEKDNNW